MCLQDEEMGAADATKSSADGSNRIHASSKKVLATSAKGSGKEPLQQKKGKAAAEKPPGFA